MSENIQLDLRIKSVNQEVVNQLKPANKSLNPTKVEDHRGDIATIITIASSVVTLLSELIGLWKKLKELDDAPDVEIENEAGDLLNLNKATEFDIENFMHESAQ